MKRGQDDVGYPTLGEVIRFLYNSAGVLPEKRDATPDFDANARRKLQKMLERLASEQGNLQENLNEAHRQLGFLVAGYAECTPIGLAIGEVIADLLDVYGSVVQEEGTYLPRQQTLRWMVIERLAPAAAVSIASHITRFDLRAFAQFFPDEPLWYVPDTQDGKTRGPLAKVMRWIYRQYSVSQTQFHSASDCAPGTPLVGDLKSDAARTTREQDLENAQNWARGHGNPSAAALAWNFDRAFAARHQPDGDDDNLATHWGAKYVSGARMALFLARWLTYVTKALEKQFGRDFLREVCAVFGDILALALAETRHVEAWIAGQARVHRLPAQDPDLRDDVVTAWKRDLGTRASNACQRLQVHWQAGSLTDEAIRRLADSYGPLAVIPFATALRRPSGHAIPDDFAEALVEGLKLAADLGASGERIDVYETGLCAAGMDKLLPWMVPWLRFQVCYRGADDAGAWHWIALAFMAARYRAGRNQYQIVNQYIEMAAKMDKRQEFEKGIHWARYIGLEVRWLHELEPTQDNIDGVMEMMRRARYPV